MCKLERYGISPEGLKKESLSSIIELIEASIKLMTPAKIEDVITNIKVRKDTNCVNIELEINRRYKAMVYGKKFSNISCLRKLVSNTSGRDGFFYKLSTSD